MTAIRSAHGTEGRFVQITNAALQDRRLSWAARGVLAFVLSLPPEQHLTAAWLEHRSPDGREKVRSALRELEKYGYYRRSRSRDARGRWTWDQVMSDSPAMISGEAASSQVAPYDGKPSDGNAHDGNPSDKRSNTEYSNTNETKMASRRASTSSETAKRTVVSVIADVRAAVAEAHGTGEAQALSDDEALGLYFNYAHREGVRDLVPYLARIFADAPYLDTFLASSEPVCPVCVQYESNCRCGAA